MTLDRQLNTPPPEYARTCKFWPWYDKQSEDDRNAIDKAFDNPDLPSRHIFRTLRDAGCPVAESSIRSHRKRECAHCERQQNGQP